MAEKLLLQKMTTDDDDDFVETPAKTTKVKPARSRRRSSFAPSPAITPIAEEEAEGDGANAKPGMQSHCSIITTIRN